MTVTKDQILGWLKACAAEFAAQQDYLTDLDREIGDADHGLNMNRGFTKVMEKLPTFEAQPIGGIMKGVGMTLMSSIGGASGPLYGTFFIRAATSTASAEELDLAALIKMLEDGVAGVVMRGKAEHGDKTMCDVWWPVLQAAKEAKDAGSDITAALDKMVAAAEEGAKSTIPMQARKGRASYLGERSVGHQDAGATSSLIMIKALAATVSGS
ncbi:dihydroxyacetone kinase subunit DhaL [Pseudovibrio sp. SPO723]|uniref:dihydroxyacetone kinase subunit DhaL n=1 Tax=Nesiotobacter zosterae TaxID=392721 RepID=UPI0029C3C55E|nr:dihydroxyacetone kinase subunit DhaL [Pseudovibrio sp. SPO723]MDX5595737.1 dihydroxyacetone kinase subunit DhaL [Pseudovibrio sp. SPO723]